MTRKSNGVFAQRFDFGSGTDHHVIVKLVEPRHGDEIAIGVERLRDAGRRRIDLQVEPHEPLAAVGPRAEPQLMRLEEHRPGKTVFGRVINRKQHKSFESSVTRLRVIRRTVCHVVSRKCQICIDQLDDFDCRAYGRFHRPHQPTPAAASQRRFVNRLADMIQPRLKIVDEFVQAAGDRLPRPACKPTRPAAGPSRCSAELREAARVACREIACSDSLARVRQCSTARGNSRSSTRKFTTFTGEIRPCRWRYISSALADRSRRATECRRTACRRRPLWAAG